jgi:hypothetical protein
MKNIYYLGFLLLTHCGAATENNAPMGKIAAVAGGTLDNSPAITVASDKTANKASRDTLIFAEGKTVRERFLLPAGYLLPALPENSFESYLGNFPLKAAGSPVHHYDGSIKAKEVHAAVLDIDVGTEDLQQCADAVMRLRAEYLYKTGAYDKIHFNFTNGMRVDFRKWAEGNRLRITGNTTTWHKAAAPSSDYTAFRAYLTKIFQYAGTASLSKEMAPVAVEEVRAGDVFIKGGFPGHAVIVMSVATHQQTGNKLCLLAQSYMPAQEIHVLKNTNQPDLSPWYDLSQMAACYTPEWTFSKSDLKRFRE